MNTTPENPAEAALVAFVMSLSPEQREQLEQAMRRSSDPRAVAAEWMAKHALTNIQAGVTLAREASPPSIGGVLDGLEVCTVEDMATISQLAHAIRQQTRSAAVKVLADQIEQLARECSESLEADCETAHALLQARPKPHAAYGR